MKQHKINCISIQTASGFIHVQPAARAGNTRLQLQAVNRPSRSFHPSRNSLCPHFKSTSSLHSISSSSSSSSVSSTSAHVWQRSCLMCPLLCTHQAKMQALLWGISPLMWVRLTRATGLFTRKDIAFQLPGVSLNGTRTGFFGAMFTFSLEVDGSLDRRLKYLFLSACSKECVTGWQEVAQFILRSFSC